MNRIRLVLLSTLLLSITLTFGCTFSHVQNDIDQLKNEISVIRKDLDGLRSSLDDSVEKLETDIRKHENQFEKEISVINNDLHGLESSLDVKVQNLNAAIQEDDSQLENEISVIRKDLNGLRSSLDDSVEKLETDIRKHESQLENSVAANMSVMYETMSKQKLYWITAILVLFLIVVGIFFFMKYEMVRLRNMLSSEFTSDMEELKNEAIQMDAKLVQVLERELEVGNLQSSQDAEPDHSLPKKVCEEIQRMRNRMKHMDQDDQARKVFSKRLESLEEKLNDMGYEMVDLENRSFNEGMTVEARFIPDENLKDGEAIITKVIKPQINHKNVLIQAAEVEVSQGTLSQI